MSTEHHQKPKRLHLQKDETAYIIARYKSVNMMDFMVTERAENTLPLNIVGSFSLTKSLILIQITASLSIGRNGDKTGEITKHAD